MKGGAAQWQNAEQTEKGTSVNGRMDAGRVDTRQPTTQLPIQWPLGVKYCHHDFYEVLKMESILIALIGVGGTLLGTLIGWILNSISYRIGRTKIYGTLVTTVTIPPVSITGNVSRVKPSGPRYSMNCVAINSRQIPVILESFCIEMQADRNKEPIRLSVYESEDDCCTMENGLKVSAQIALRRQYILPRTLYEFSMKIGCSDPQIQFSRLTRQKDLRIHLVPGCGGVSVQADGCRG